MAYDSSAILRTGPAAFVLQAVIVSVSGILLLILFILFRRWIRNRYFRRRDERVLVLRQRWSEILEGTYSPKKWSADPLSREIVENMLLDSIEVADGEELERLQRCLRSSALIQRRITETRKARGRRRKTAILALGRTRVPEAIPALTECLDSDHVDVRITAVRGLGRIALPKAALPILDRVDSGTLRITTAPLRNALLSCCRSDPRVLIPYLHAGEEVRRHISRVLAELAGPELSEHLRELASDPDAEVRASAARGLAGCDVEFSVPILCGLIADEMWFVRLRAVIALGHFESDIVEEPLIMSLQDRSRLVRQNAASALVKQGRALADTLRRVIELQDPYAFQAMVSELQRANQYELLVRSLRDGAYSYTDSQLLEALEQGRNALLFPSKKQERAEVAAV